MKKIHFVGAIKQPFICFHFLVPPAEFNTVAEWLYDNIHGIWYIDHCTALITRCAVPDLQVNRVVKKYPKYRFVSLTSITDIIRFEQHFPIVGLTPDLLF
jgi:hypothetical protein